MKTRYYVWKRNDGFIHCTAYRPRDYKHANGHIDKNGHDETTFEILGEFDEWTGAVVDFIEAKRAEHAK